MPTRDRLPLILPGVALLSACSLSLEVSLVRVFSVMLSHHFVFAVVSLALLGLAVGALLLPWTERHLPRLEPSGMAAGLAVAVAGSLAALLVLPRVLAPLPLTLTFAAAALLAMLPYVALGLSTAAIFRRRPERSSLIYGADLAGAAAGALLAVPALDALGAPGGCLVSAVLAGASGLLLGIGERGRPRLPASVATLTVAALLAAYAAGARAEIPMARDPGKDLLRVSSPEIVESRWSSFGRTDLVRDPSLPGEMALYVDGAAGTTMYAATDALSDPVAAARLQAQLPEYLELTLLSRAEMDSAAIIGAGGGKDVVAALLAGVRSITAVEVNPDVVTLVREWEAWNGGIYSRLPQVEVVVDEGRRFLRAAPQGYDLIVAALPVTKSSRSIQGFALTEGYLYTVEALGEYLDRLTPEGRLLLVAHHGVELHRLIELLLEAFQRRGEAPALAVRHLYTFSPGSNPVLVVQRRPFEPRDIDLRYLRIQELGWDQGPFYLPRLAELVAGEHSRLEGPTFAMLDRNLLAIERGEAARAPQFRPVTDDSPFFYQFDPRLPAPLPQLAAAAGASLLLLLAGAAFACRSSPSRRASYAGAGVSSLLGVGFLLVEIALFQRLMLYVGRPPLALTALLFSLLLGAGAGSLLSARLVRRPGRAAAAACVAIAAALAVSGALSPTVVGASAHPALSAPLLLVPLGALMGLPFPLCLRLLAGPSARTQVPLALAANGVASVLGSVLAMVVGMVAGFSWALALGAGVYLLAALVFWRWNRGSVPSDGSASPTPPPPAALPRPTR